jgi:hypothetical protein
MMKRTIGAFHSAYYNNDKFKVVLGNFRNYFPVSPYVIYSDMGDDFTNHINDFTFYRRSEIRYFGTGPNAYWNDNWEIWHSYYKRLKDSCLICDTDYVILMEDDVLIRNYFEITEDFDLCGPCGGSLLTNHIVSYIEKKTGTKINPHYGLSGGAIFNARKFLKYYNQILDNLHQYHYEYSDHLKEPVSLVGDGNFAIQFNLLGLNYTCSKWLGNEIIHPWK